MKKQEQTRNSTQIRRTREDTVFDVITVLFLGALLLIIAYPLYFVLIASISDPYEVLNGNVLFLAKGINFDAYKRIFQDKTIWIGYFNTFAYTVCGTMFNVALTMMIAYPLSRKNFSGRKTIMTLLIITMYFGGGMIPTYMLVNKLQLRNTFWVMIVLGAVSVYNIIIARTFLESNISTELEEAASIDGCSQLKFFTSMVIPLSKSVIAILVLYYAVAHWNDYMRGLLYLDKAEKFPLQLVIRSILLQTKTVAADTMDVFELDARMKLAESIKYGVIIISSLPVLVLYPFVQKHFVKGVMIGSVKG
ncbi:MAG: carbohydrate ABC transporter permease [Angelakisella sp.]